MHLQWPADLFQSGFKHSFLVPQKMFIPTRLSFLKLFQAILNQNNVGRLLVCRIIADRECQANKTLGFDINSKQRCKNNTKHGPRCCSCSCTFGSGQNSKMERGATSELGWLMRKMCRETGTRPMFFRQKKWTCHNSFFKISNQISEFGSKFVQFFLTP